jgi:hypothetical protein
MVEEEGRPRQEGPSDGQTSSAYSSSSLSSSEDEGDRHKNKMASKNLRGFSCFTGDGLCGMARSSSSKKNHQSDSDSDSKDEVRNEFLFLREENERLGQLLDNCDDMLKEAKKMS